MSATETLKSRAPELAVAVDQELARLIQKRDDILKELGQIEQSIAERQSAVAVRYIDAEEATAASSRIFEENAELFKKLAK